jgi:dipeptidyl aminopeptidase/acylaminoacyl peptidase
LVILAAIMLVLRLTGCMERLFYYPEKASTPPPAEFADAQSVWFSSADGTRLHGWFIPSQISPTEKSPTILHVHGNAGNITSHIWFTEYLPRSGFNLFIFDYRGYGQSEGSARKRAQLVADTNAALDAMLKQPAVDPARIGLYGQSLGGAIGLCVMADRPEIRAAVFESAFASWQGEAANAVGGEPPSWIGRTIAWLLINDSHRPDEAIARIGRPILLVHGTSDRTIPLSHSQKLAAASNGHATLIEYPGGDHNTLRETHPEMAQTVIDFFHVNLPIDSR